MGALSGRGSALTARSPVVARARRLTKRAFRAVDRAFLVEGVQGVTEALGASALTGLFVTAEAGRRHDDLLVRASAASVPPCTCDYMLLPTRLGMGDARGSFRVPRPNDGGVEVGHVADQLLVWPPARRLFVVPHAALQEEEGAAQLGKR